jgi:spermidine synthase
MTIYFLSGACSLIDEVVWARLLKLSLGNTVYASTIVVSVFMGGLALGALIMGRYADKVKNRMRLYAGIEILVTITALLFPLTLKLMDAGYRGIFNFFSMTTGMLVIVQIIASALVLLVPSMLMGSTFPLISRVVTSLKNQIGNKIGKLYALNMLGASLGCFLAGFVTIRLIGVMGTVYLAAGLNLVVALGGYVLSRYLKTDDVGLSESPVIEEKSSFFAPEKSDTIISKALLIAIFMSGFISIGYELIWMRSIIFLLGGPTYVFSAVLSVYLFGNVFGAMLGSYLSKRTQHPFVIFGISLTILGILGMTYIHWLNYWQVNVLPGLVNSTRGIWLDTHFRSLFFPLLNSLVLFFIPSLFMGVGFPLALQAWGNIRHKIGQTTAHVYGINTIGAVLGGVVIGFGFIPLMGVQYSILTTAILGVWLGSLIVFYFLWSIKWAWRLSILAVPVLFTILFIAIPHDYFNRQFVSNAVEDSKVIALKEGINTIVSVHETKDGAKIIATSGVKVAGDRPGFRITQKILGHLGFLLNKNTEDALTVGFGSGETSKCMTLHNPDNVHVIEIAPELLEVSLKNFSHINLGETIHQKNNVKVILNDAKNYLHLTNKKYDLLVTDAINPKQIAENASLYTLEYFQTAYKRLKPGGYIGCWLPIQEIPISCVNSILKTFADVFPHVTLWLPITAPSNYDFLYLLGSVDPQQYDPFFIEEQFKNPEIAKSLEYINFKNSHDVLNCYLGDEVGLRKYLKDFPLNSDIHPYVEFNTDVNAEKTVLREWLSQLVSTMGNHDVSDKLVWGSSDQSKIEEWKKVDETFKAPYDYLLEARLESDNIVALEECGKGLALLPGNPGLLKNEEFILLGIRYSIFNSQEGLPNANAIPQTLHQHPNYGTFWLVDSWIRTVQKDYKNAYNSAMYAYQLLPDNPVVLENLGSILIEMKQVEGAIKVLERAYYFAPDNSLICSRLGKAYSMNQNYDLALFMFKEVTLMEPLNATAFYNVGMMNVMMGNKAEAKDAFDKALEIDPSFEKAREILAKL